MKMLEATDFTNLGYNFPFGKSTVLEFTNSRTEVNGTKSFQASR
jgi:hypothetical protein